MDEALFAVTMPGLEEIAAGELRAQGAAEVAPVPGGVDFRGDPRALWRANLELRTVGRILLRVGAFEATRFDDLRRRVAALPWERFLSPGDGLGLRVACHKSRLWHSGGVAERVVEAVQQRLGFEVPKLRPTNDEEAAAAATSGPRLQLVLVRLERDRCTVSVDASGEPLHRRGHRLAVGRAPLRETLAAALVLASGWDARSPLLDPFCGSGAIAIEAALLARRRAPGRARRFAFEAWPGHDAAGYAALLAEVDARAAEAPAPPPILASDRDAGAVRAALANAERAGVLGDVAFARRSLSELAAPEGPGAVVTNPPHGVRLSKGADLRDLYARLGQTLRERCSGWTVTLLSTGPTLWTAAGLSLEPAVRVVQGGLKLVLVTGRVPERP